MHMVARRSRSICLVFLAAALGVVTTPLICAGPIESQATVSSDVVSHKGIVVSDSQIVGTNNAILATRVADFKTLGVKWVRLAFTWQDIQPNSANDFLTSQYDAVVKALEVADINVLGLICYSTSWANGHQSQFVPPTSPATYGNYASKLASHFGPMGVHTWEIWNEPNVGNFWSPAPDPAAYTALIKAAYFAIHQVDSGATVITAGLSQPSNSPTTIDAREYLGDIYHDGGKPYFDAVGDHPYGRENWAKMFSTSPSFLSIMVTNGDGNKKIWVTETGTPTGTASGAVTERQQAAEVIQSYANAVAYPWIGPIFWYDYMDDCDNAADPECNFGLKKETGSKKPSYAAYQAAPN